jgi:hypothetical protein
MAMHLLDRRESGWRCAYKIDGKILSFGQKRGLSITLYILPSALIEFPLYLYILFVF